MCICRESLAGPEANAGCKVPQAPHGVLQLALGEQILGVGEAKQLYLMK